MLCGFHAGHRAPITHYVPCFVTFLLMNIVSLVCNLMGARMRLNGLQKGLKMAPKKASNSFSEDQVPLEFPKIQFNTK